MSSSPVLHGHHAPLTSWKVDFGYAPERAREEFWFYSGGAGFRPLVFP